MQGQKKNKPRFNSFNSFLGYYTNTFVAAKERTRALKHKDIIPPYCQEITWVNNQDPIL